MDVAIVTVHMKMGGIRQSLLNLLDYTNALDWSVDLYVFCGDLVDIKETLGGRKVSSIQVLKHMNVYGRTYSEQEGMHDKIRKICYGFSSRIIGRERMIYHIINSEKGCRKKYDLAISYANGIWTGGSRNFSGGCELYVLHKLEAYEKVAWIHSNPKNLGITNEIGKRIYSRFDKVVNVSYGCRDIFNEICPDLKDRSYVIYNLVNTKRILKLCDEIKPYNSNKKFIIVTVARLDNKSKRLDILAECCKMLKDAGKEFEWHIVGDGTDRSMLREMIERYKLENYLFMEGKKMNPYPYMKYATVYVCTSSYEAFPLVIRESQTVCTPVLTTPIPPAYELVDDEIDGLIADFSAESITKKIIELMNDSSKVQRMRTYLKQNNNKYRDSLDDIRFVLLGDGNK